MTYNDCVCELMRNNAFILIMGMLSIYTPSRHKASLLPGKESMVSTEQETG